MNFEIFDSLECECGGRELRLQEPVFGRAPAQDIVDCVLCKRFCGYKQCPIRLENVPGRLPKMPTHSRLQEGTPS